METIYGRALKANWQEVKDKYDLLSLRQLLVELSEKISRLPFTPEQTLFRPSCVNELVWHVDELREAINNPKALLAEHVANSLLHFLGRDAAEHVANSLLHFLGHDAIDPLAKRLLALCSDLVKFSRQIRLLAQIAHDPSLEAFCPRIEGFIRLLSNEDTSKFELLFDEDASSGGSNGSNGSGDYGGGFPGCNPKLMSSNRSMPWYQPRYFD